MGWNSWDCYGTTVREDEVVANADFMAAHLARYGWNTIVVDIQWYEPDAKAGGYRKDAALVITLPPGGFLQATAEGAVNESVKAAAKRFASMGASVEEISIPMHMAGPAIWTPIGNPAADSPQRTTAAGHPVRL